MRAHLVDTVEIPAVPPGDQSQAPSRGSQRAGSVVRGGPVVSVPLASGAISAATASSPALPLDRRARLSQARRERRERRRVALLSILGLLAALGATVLVVDMVR